MLKLYRVTRLKVFFLVLVYVFNFNLFECSAAILEKGLIKGHCHGNLAAAKNLFSNKKCYREKNAT